MKYIRRENEILEVIYPSKDKNSPVYTITNVFRQRPYLDEFENLPHADTIEELCDEFVHKNYAFKSLQELYDYWEDMYSYDQPTYGAIWTDKGLIYVAKMNDKGVLELL